MGLKKSNTPTYVFTNACFPIMPRFKNLAQVLIITSGGPASSHGLSSHHQLDLAECHITPNI